MLKRPIILGSVVLACLGGWPLSVYPLTAETGPQKPACVQKGNQVLFTGTDNRYHNQGTDAVFAELRGGDLNCSCTNVRFHKSRSQSNSSTDLNLVLSVLLTAQVAQRTIRIDFTRSQDCDSAYRVYLGG